MEKKITYSIIPDSFCEENKTQQLDSDEGQEMIFIVGFSQNSCRKNILFEKTFQLKRLGSHTKIGEGFPDGGNSWCKGRGQTQLGRTEALKGQCEWS